jgi:hypothetical protein
MKGIVDAIYTYGTRLRYSGVPFVKSLLMPNVRMTYRHHYKLHNFRFDGHAMWSGSKDDVPLVILRTDGVCSYGNYLRI